MKPRLFLGWSLHIRYSVRKRAWDQACIPAQGRVSNRIGWTEVSPRTWSKVEAGFGESGAFYNKDASPQRSGLTGQGSADLAHNWSNSLFNPLASPRLSPAN